MYLYGEAKTMYLPREGKSPESVVAACAYVSQQVWERCRKRRLSEENDREFSAESF